MIFDFFKGLFVFTIMFGLIRWYIQCHYPKHSKYYYLFWISTIISICMQLYYNAYHVDFTPMDSRTGAEAWEENMR